MCRRGLRRPPSAAASYCAPPRRSDGYLALARRMRDGVREDYLLYRVHPRWIHRYAGRLVGVALPARGTRGDELSGVHQGRRRDCDGLGDLPVDAAAPDRLRVAAVAAVAVHTAGVGVHVAGAL